MSPLITKNHKWVILALLNLASSLCLVSLALLSKYILDAAQAKDKESVLVYTGILIGLILIAIGFKLVENILYGRYYIAREMELKHILLERRLSLAFEEKSFHSAILMQNYTTDVSNILSGEMDVFPALFYQIGRFCFALIIVAILDWKILLILIGIGLLGLFFARVYSRRMKKLHKDVLLKDGTMNSFFQETVENVVLVKAYSAQESFMKHYDCKAEEAKTARKKKFHLQIFTNNLMTLTSNLVYGACIGYGGYAIAVQWITYGSLLALTQLIQHLQNPILSLSGLLNRYSLAKTSYQRFNDSLKGKALTKGDIHDFDCILAEDVSFGYEGKEQIVNHLSFEIKKGQIVRIAGESGIGKTTLMMLLMGVLKPSEGSIKVYAQKQPILSDVYSLFAYVPQDNILFSSTIRENFELLASCDEDKMWEALEFACLKDEISSLDLTLNERGKGLSIGQIQRLAIAIAYAKDRPIFLLDEFTSALDENNSNQIMKHLLSTNKTIIYVSHKTDSLNPDVVLQMKH